MATMGDKHPESVPSLMEDLRYLQKTQPKAVRSTLNHYPAAIFDNDGQGSRDREITSWKMTEHMYFAKDNQLPTLARGLFTEEVEEGDTLREGEFDGEEWSEKVEEESGQGDKSIILPKRDRIVGRGYDKFFNIDEMAWTSWSSIKEHTEAPYHLTLKSNGCLILVSALSPDHLMIGSKHSLGLKTAIPVQTHAPTTSIVEPSATTPEAVASPSPTIYDSVSSMATAAANYFSGLAIFASASRDGEAPSSEISKTSQDETAADGTRKLNLSGEDSFSIDGNTACSGLSKNQAKREEKQKNKEEQKRRNKEPRNVAKAAEPSDERDPKDHAAAGRDWVARTLQSSGRTEKELAAALWEKNLSAVLELCDDQFEEHVIATPEHLTGLHLHGLNHNTPHFSTLSPDEVESFAKEFGFIPTKHITLQSIDEVRKYTDRVAETGSWEGDMIEGFVVRSKVKANAENDIAGKPPYRPGSPFFFKVKFDEPYLLYRTFREITRTMLPLLKLTVTGPDKGARESIWKTVKSKSSKRQELGVYAFWVGETMQSEPELFDHYDKGVVKVRERFLRWTEGEGKPSWEAAKAGKWTFGELSKSEEEIRAIKAKLPSRWLVVPIAVPGCGKTMIGVVLSKLFGIAHTQSDDILTKRTAPGFIANIEKLLKTNDIVYADRNNHIVKHYTELAQIADKKSFADVNLRMIGLVWDIESKPYHQVLRICSERVVKRGDNHQTLRPDFTMQAEHEAIVSKFINDYIHPDETDFHLLISIKIDDTLQTTLETICNGLVDITGLPRPTKEDIALALEASSEYTPLTPYHPLAKAGSQIRYFGIAPEIDLSALVETALSQAGEKAESARHFFDSLRSNNRIAFKPHITLSHNQSVAREKEEHPDQIGPEAELWDTCKSLSELSQPVLYDFNMTHLVWDDRVMAFAVDAIVPPRIDSDTSIPQLGLPEEVRVNLHVTVGTQSEDIRPYESRNLVKMIREGGSGEAVEGGGEVKWFSINPIKGVGRVKGMW